MPRIQVLARARRTRRVLVVPIVAAMLVTALLVGRAQAVHDLDFELDGNQAVDAGGPAFDWTSFFNAAGQPSPALPDATRPGFTNSAFSKDFTRKANGAYSTVDTTTFATGSKDTLNITPGWQCNKDNNVSDKVDIVNAYAAAFTNPATNATGGHDEILYFGLERFSNDGDANVGFWFLQDNVNCVSPGGAVAFTGNHVDGDLLIVSAFTKGGVVSTIDVYRWNGGAGGSLNTTPVAHGVDCKTTLGGDATCATVNDPTNGTLDPPWDTANKDGTSVNEVSEFFEGGLNLTEKGLAGKCFNTFIADTRSSQSLTATLFDFARGLLGECGVSMTTTPSQTTRTLSSTDPVTDTATVSGSTSSGTTAPTPTGTVTFFLCAPSQLTPATTGTCGDSNGTQVGSAVTVTVSVPGTATATSADAKSLITGIGKYCFRAHFAAAADDPNYAGKTAETSNPADECFTVTDTSSIKTDQTWLPNDTATVTTAGGAAVSGMVTFTLYENGDCTAPAKATFTDSNAPYETNNTSVYVSTQTISWKAHFAPDNGVAPSDSSCETSTVTINNNHP